MLRACWWSVAAMASAGLGCHVSDVSCDRETYGRQCEGANEYTSCSVRSCEDNPSASCKERTFVDDHACPADRPVCADASGVEAPDIVCKGEVLGPCDAIGFVECPDPNTVIVCLMDETGALVLSRGTCGSGETCQEPFPLHAGGCTSLSPG